LPSAKAYDRSSRPAPTSWFYFESLLGLPVGCHSFANRWTSTPSSLHPCSTVLSIHPSTSNANDSILIPSRSHVSAYLTTSMLMATVSVSCSRVSPPRAVPRLFGSPCFRLSSFRISSCLIPQTQTLWSPTQTQIMTPYSKPPLAILAQIAFLSNKLKWRTAQISFAMAASYKFSAVCIQFTLIQLSQPKFRPKFAQA
jgi:hypothetical protein